MKKETGITVFLSILVSGVVVGQTKQTQHVQQLWPGYFNQTGLAKKWGIRTDVHLRIEENFFTQYALAYKRPSEDNGCYPLCARVG